MNRRGFLGFLGAAIVGATLDPEKAIWEPGRKLISIPRVSTVGTFNALYIRPAMEQIAAQIDAEIADYLKYRCEIGYGWMQLPKAEHTVFLAS